MSVRVYKEMKRDIYVKYEIDVEEKRKESKWLNSFEFHLLSKCLNKVEHIQGAYRSKNKNKKDQEKGKPVAYMQSCMRPKSYFEFS